MAMVEWFDGGVDSVKDEVYRGDCQNYILMPAGPAPDRQMAHILSLI